jgi:hypothetical protein
MKPAQAYKMHPSPSGKSPCSHPTQSAVCLLCSLRALAKLTDKSFRVYLPKNGARERELLTTLEYFAVLVDSVDLDSVVDEFVGVHSCFVKVFN